MTGPETDLGHQPRPLLLSRIRTVLLDFDGPICDLFSNLPNYAVADRLRELLRNHNVTLAPRLSATVDPFDLFRATASLSPNLIALVETALTEAELCASNSCHPTPHAEDLIVSCTQSMRSVAVVSNTAATAIKRYLTDRMLDEHIDAIMGRVECSASLLKPNPYLVRRAIAALGADSATSVLIGDQVTDVEAAHRAGAWAIGYANKPGKGSQLEAAGADAIVTDLSALAAEFLRIPPAE